MGVVRRGGIGSLVLREGRADAEVRGILPARLCAGNRHNQRVRCGLTFGRRKDSTASILGALGVDHGFSFDLVGVIVTLAFAPLQQRSMVFPIGPEHA